MARAFTTLAPPTFAFVAAVTAGGCRPTACEANHAAAPLATAAPAAASTATPPTPTAPAVAPGFEETLLSDHPLVGRILAPATGAFVPQSELEAAVRGAHFVLLGEKHDNRDHHRLQADLVRAFLRDRGPAAVAFEMLDLGQQAAVDGALAAHPALADAVGGAVDWDTSGWPVWSMYRPVFQAALDGRARIVAANLARPDAMAIARQGASAPPLAGLALPPLPESELHALEEEIRESHCGAMPESMTAGMVMAQRARDATMAARLAAADTGAGAALVAGAGHARKDRGVPRALAAASVGTVLAVAWVEVVRGEIDAAAYVERGTDGSPTFDYLWFTPRVDEDDPCAELMHNGN